VLLNLSSYHIFCFNVFYIRIIGREYFSQCIWLVLSMMLEFELESWDPLHIALSSVMWRTLLFLTSRQTCLHYCSLSLSFWINISSSVSLLMILACLLFCAF